MFTITALYGSYNIVIQNLINRARRVTTMRKNMRLTEDGDELDGARRYTCIYCIRYHLWRDRRCFGDMCRYQPEIELIERDLLNPEDVQFGEWNPTYELTNGKTFTLKNKKQVADCADYVRRRFG